MTSILKALKQYRPDPAVLDAPTHFDEIAQPYFHKGNETGCLVLHGIGGTPANVRVLSDALVESGYTVLAPMLPGHGETVRALNASTDEQWLHHVLASFDRLKSEGCTRIFAMGLSLGGVLCGVLAEERPLDGLVLICTPIRMTRFLRFARLISPILPFVSYGGSDQKDAVSEENNPYTQMYNGFSTAKLHDLTRLSRRLKRNLPRIVCPTLWISAQYDTKVAPVSPIIFRRRAINVPSFDEVHFARSPHGCTYGPEREAVAARVAAFVSSLTR